jgi:hypothetical protein
LQPCRSDTVSTRNHSGGSLDADDQNSAMKGFWRIRLDFKLPIPESADDAETELRGWYRKNDYMGISRATLPQGLKEQSGIEVRKGA